MRYLLICFQTGLLRINTTSKKIEGGPSVNRFRLSADSVCQQIPSVSRFRLSADSVCQQIPSVSRFRLSADSVCQQIPSVSRFRLSADSVCQQIPSVSRFRLSARDYNNIREIVIDNCQVMEQTKIQLPEISVWTLTQWYVCYCHIHLLPIPPPGPPGPEA